MLISSSESAATQVKGPIGSLNHPLLQQVPGEEVGDDDESVMYDCEKVWTNEALKTLRDCDDEQTVVSKVGELYQYALSSRTLAWCYCFAVFSPCIILVQLGRRFSGSIDVRTSVGSIFFWLAVALLPGQEDSDSVRFGRISDSDPSDLVVRCVRSLRTSSHAHSPSHRRNLYKRITPSHGKKILVVSR